ncbi:hypothetical protein CRU94_09345 [Arcobacter sp. AHV-9/2010]|uniref:hypothetical protein n=1 Tax=Arcobacter sp. AHV-9/2010 TaxID=2021861 RepID=UPI00100B1BDD|nr:hypothetical protein [Arcobacter sp. CECT 9299]RXJ94025.1 hypothetical protein CRU94_09345 [Arcobacter sp. CECT 9299]
MENLNEKKIIQNNRKKYNLKKIDTKEIRNTIKTSMYFIIIIFMAIAFFIPFQSILFLSVILIILFTIVSLTIYTFTKNEENRKLLINIWRMYAPSIIVLHSILFSMYGYIYNIEMDYIKTDLNYNLQLKKDGNNQNINDKYNNYKKHMEEYIKVYDKIHINTLLKNTYSDDKFNSNDEKYIFWWAQPILLIINLLTLFMCMRLINELNLKKRVINSSNSFDIISKYY